MKTAMYAALGAVGYMVLDGLWLGVLMKDFYRDQLAPIARLSNGQFAPHWGAALIVYVALGAGIACFVVPRATSVTSAAGFGALFGLVVYAVYDFTNYATLRQFPLAVTVLDVVWGAVASAVCAVAVWMVAR
jgi:uncharacterized membrane protein